MEIIAHRGASGYAPENTISSFKKAIELGSTSFEFDVQMTKDGKLVVIHDEVLGRTVDTTGYVIYTNYMDIVNHSAGKWFSDEYAHERVPLLEEVLDLFSETDRIHLEIKKLFIDNRNMEDKIYSMLKAFKFTENTIVSSFNHRSIKYFNDKYDTKVGVLFDAGLINIKGYLDSAGIKPYSINNSAGYVDNDFVDMCHSLGYKVLSYTVNDKMVGAFLEKSGVDGIFTNYLKLFN